MEDCTYMYMYNVCTYMHVHVHVRTYICTCMYGIGVSKIWNDVAKTRQDSLIRTYTAKATLKVWLTFHSKQNKNFIHYMYMYVYTCLHQHTHTCIYWHVRTCMLYICMYNVCTVMHSLTKVQWVLTHLSSASSFSPLKNTYVHVPPLSNTCNYT